MANVKVGDLALVIKGVHGRQRCPCMIGRAIVRIAAPWPRNVGELAWSFEDVVRCLRGFTPVTGAFDSHLMRIDGPESSGSRGDRLVHPYVAEVAHIKALLRRSFRAPKKAPETSKEGSRGRVARGKGR